MFNITVSETREVFSCPDDKSVLEGMVRLGRRGIPLGCRGGACGVCKVEVLSGRYVQKPMSRCHVDADDEREGRVLACRISPSTDLEIRVVGNMKRAVLSQAAPKQA
ncbi:MAG: 2Fe-2S iron-sulfur cluster binding domain-containing protein [Pseudomonadota bacterium]|nr:2Fe-2S iron-sulfur cluster binding domain-containing protein [Terriglobales bacterium]